MGCPVGIILAMFVRKKHNKSGSISVQIIDKTDRYRVVQTVGSSTDPDEIERLFLRGQQIVQRVPDVQQSLLAVKSDAELAVENFIEDLTHARVRTIGPENIFGTLFDRIGFNAIPDALFRHLVITRLAYPGSKLKTIDYLHRYCGVRISASTLYRSLDRFHEQYKEQAETIAYRQSRKRIGAISVVFYDMTTLYFEAEDEDDLRKVGFSKDGKFQCPQIMLGLLVGERGYPIGYDLFAGNTFEGHTLVPTLRKMQERYGFPKPVVVADAGLLSNKNIAELTQQGYQYILGARIRNESDAMKAHILEHAKGLKDGAGCVIVKPDGTRLIVTYTDKRARKDRHMREKGLKKLQQKVKTGHLTKESINNRGYNKFLTLKGSVEVSIDEAKVVADAQWDGLKGYLTNTDMSVEEVVTNYAHLWRIEKAFRVSKTDLRVRPIHHYKQRRIEAHICIAFVAYAVYKELEYVLERHGAPFSAQRAAELTHTMYSLEFAIPHSGEKRRLTLYPDEEQRMLYDMIRKS